MWGVLFGYWGLGGGNEMSLFQQWIPCPRAAINGLSLVFVYICQSGLLVTYP